MTTPAPEPTTIPEAAKSAPILPLLAIGFGAYFLWFGVKYWKGSGNAIWPSYPVRSVLQGQGVPANIPATDTPAATLTAYETPLTAAEVAAGAAPAPGTPGPTGTGQKKGTTTAGGRGSGGGTGSGATGSVYGNGALQGLWIMAGGNPAKAGVAACIAEHESSGRVTVTSRNPDGGTNVGLWQLDTPGGKGAGFTVAELMNPLTNARVAVRGSSNGTDWSAWATAGACGV